MFATGRNPHQLADLVDGHDNATALKIDVTSAEDITAAAAAVEQAGGMGVLINNAGYGYLTAFEEADEAGYRAQFEANMTSGASGCGGFCRSCRHRENGYGTGDGSKTERRLVRLLALE
jgi:NAD(P)-dependent dehydrogenase (short-subunit alcohol dehydrogenase family)